MAAFMVPEYLEVHAFIIDTDNGTEYLPDDGSLFPQGVAPSPSEVAPYCESEVFLVERSEKAGVLCRLTAPGYMDCTDWAFFEGDDAMQQAREYIAETYDCDPDSGELLGD